MAEIAEIIAQVGFPIGMCIILFWYLMEENKSHKEEMDNLRKTLEANTLAITKLTDKLED